MFLHSWILKKIFVTYFLFLLISFSCSGEDFESNQMADVLSLADQETWIVCDVDNTLIESCTYLGSAQWRSYIRKKALAAGFDREKAEEITDQFWLFVQPFITVRSVDPNSDFSR